MGTLLFKRHGSFFRCLITKLTFFLSESFSQWLNKVLYVLMYPINAAFGADIIIKINVIELSFYIGPKSLNTCVYVTVLFRIVKILLL